MRTAEECAEQGALTIGWEMAVLGTTLYDPQTMEIAEELLPSDFSVSHQIISGATGVIQPILWIKANNNFRALEMRTVNLNPSEEEE